MATMFLQAIIPIGILVLALYVRRRFSRTVLKRYNSDISGPIDVSRKYNGELTLMTNYFVQGVSIEKPSIGKSYWYAMAESILRHCENRKDATILFIGLGANSSSLLINRNNPTINQVIIEIDPLVIRACREYFHLDSMKNTEVITADIFEMLSKKKQAWKKTYDCIVIDTFEANPPYLLKNSHDPEFLDVLSTWLKPDGMLLFNIPVKTQGIHVPKLVSYLKKNFEKGEQRIIHDPRGYHNHFITAENKK